MTMVLDICVSMGAMWWRCGSDKSEWEHLSRKNILGTYGFNIKHKRTERLYRGENITLKDMRPRRKKKAS
ncbi:hypothetical protein HGB13_05085 [bacterium]|nr:hypothetical protein [bacterium]